MPYQRITRGIRNNNPGNIDRGQDWQGQAVPENMTPEQRAEHRFAVFQAPEWGIRALLRVLVTYQAKHKKRNVREIISRWAPPVENDTEAYIRFVCAQMGVGDREPISVADRKTAKALANAIIFHENAGYRYPDDVMEKALDLANIT